MYVKTDVWSYKNSCISGNLYLAPAEEKIKDVHLRWFGNVQRILKISPYDYDMMECYNLQVQVTKRKGRQERPGRNAAVRKDMIDSGVNREHS